MKKYPWFLCPGRLPDDVVTFLLLDLDDDIALGGGGGRWSALNLSCRSCSVSISINLQLLGVAYKYCSCGIRQPARSQYIGEMLMEKSHLQIKSFKVASAGSLLLNFSSMYGNFSQQISQ